MKQNKGQACCKKCFKESPELQEDGFHFPSKYLCVRHNAVIKRKVLKFKQKWFADWKTETEYRDSGNVRLILRLPNSKSKQKMILLTVKENSGLHWLFSHFERALMELSESVETTLPEDTKFVRTTYPILGGKK